MRNLCVTISDTNLQFPFVTVEKFETHGENTRSRSKLEAIVYAPFVNESLKEEWESWSFRNQDWIKQSREAFGRDNEHRPVYLDGHISPFIYRRRDGVFVEHASSDAFYVPTWYLSPPPFNPAVVNFDIASQLEYQPLLHHVLNNKRSGFSPVTNVESFTSLQISDADHLKEHEKLTVIQQGIGYDQPHSLYAHPVFSSSGKEYVVGVVMGAIAWDAHFGDLLPVGIHGHGVICILRCVCDDQEKKYSYRLDGQRVRFMGCRPL